MTEERKQDYTRRITQASRGMIVVLTFEMALDYLTDVRQAKTEQERNAAIRRVKRCVSALHDALNYEYELSFVLMRLYNYVNECMDKALFRRDDAWLEEPEKIMSRLHSAFEEAVKSDDSEAVMQNAEAVYTGLTYGPEGMNTSFDNAGRGFRA
ncbi:MAG: flagellar protein FliS [Lachnospiraceae bacterium]|nr:flagellar protein FliS [Lachnospiraceae bacterium]